MQIHKTVADVLDKIGYYKKRFKYTKEINTLIGLINKLSDGLPEDGVILTRERYNKFILLYDELRDSYYQGQQEIELYYNSIVIPKIKKYTVEKFANKVYKELYKLGRIYALPETFDADKYGIFSITQEVIAKIAKEQFDAEIKD